MHLRLIECPPFTTPEPSYRPGDCWYARDGGWACKTCSCLWHQHSNESWSLFDEKQEPGPCCDNVAMDLKRVWYWWADHDRTVKPAGHQYAEIAPEHASTRPMIVVLPTGVAFCLHSPTFRDGKPGPSGWAVVGKLPNVTVTPSINYGTPESPTHWHGSILTGELR